MWQLRGGYADFWALIFRSGRASQPARPARCSIFGVEAVKYAVPSFDVHCRDCERILGDRHEKVNRWLDELFRMKGPAHRKLRHHAHGIQLAQQLFGIEGAKAAIVHVVRDCGHVPNDSDYVSDPCLVS
jgi:hypothetical protein